MKKNRGIAIALAFIFGGFGVHKFYLKDPGAGIFYIILNIVTLRMLNFGVATFLGWMDAFRLLSMDTREFDRRYNWNHMQKNYSDVSQHRPSSKRHKSIQKRRQNQKVKQRHQQRSNPYKKDGIKLFKDYDLPGAKDAFEKAVEISPNDPDLHFNMACVYSLLEETDKAFIHLQNAVANGFKNTEMIHGHDALAFLRIQPEFESFVENQYKFRPSTHNVSKSTEDVLPHLEKLKELRDKGLITELEYIKEKQKLTR